MKKDIKKFLLTILYSVVSCTSANAISLNCLSLAKDVLKNVITLNIGGALLCYAHEGEKLEVKMPGSDENIISLSPKMSGTIGTLACLDSLLVDPAMKIRQRNKVKELENENLTPEERAKIQDKMIEVSLGFCLCRIQIVLSVLDRNRNHDLRLP
jgi:hypothetical protein